MALREMHEQVFARHSELMERPGVSLIILTGTRVIITRVSRQLSHYRIIIIFRYSMVI